jgi:ProP effector
MRKQLLHPRTAAINQTQKNRSKLLRLEALQWLAKKFPEAFNNQKCIRPLNLGIMNEILECAKDAEDAGISKSKLREAVVVFTRRVDYLACLKAREARIDLFGNPGEKVSDDDANRAAIKLKQRVEKSLKNSRKFNSPNADSSAGKKQPNYPSKTQPYPAENFYNKTNYCDNLNNSFSETTKTQNVTITHKQSRQYDPNAVMRLKEKLGLSRKQKETE